MLRMDEFIIFMFIKTVILMGLCIFVIVRIVLIKMVVIILVRGIIMIIRGRVQIRLIMIVLKAIAAFCSRVVMTSMTVKGQAVVL